MAGALDIDVHLVSTHVQRMKEGYFGKVNNNPEYSREFQMQCTPIGLRRRSSKQAPLTIQDKIRIAHLALVDF